MVMEIDSVTTAHHIQQHHLHPLIVLHLTSIESKVTNPQQQISRLRCRIDELLLTVESLPARGTGFTPNIQNLKQQLVRFKRAKSTADKKLSNSLALLSLKDCYVQEAQTTIAILKSQAVVLEEWLERCHISQRKASTRASKNDMKLL
jgi:hypothetical protein